MSFDLSRIRFDARNDFLGVVMQQGRVQLDADWNEWVAQLARRIQAGTLDTFFDNVVPRVTPDGFLIEAGGGSFTIGPGRIYVDGLLAENHGGDPDAWDPRLAELTGTTPVSYLEQPYLPNPPDLPDDGPHLVYVDVWQRDITPQIQPDLIEPAVGVDSTGRLQTVWQVKVLETEGNITCATPDENIPNWLEEIAPSAARLTTDTGDPTFEPDPCQIPPAAGYRGLENQLYRVEVHRGGALGEASFKWSRDNGSVATRATHINPARDRVTVESIGRDDVLRFHDGGWVEVTDDWRELHGLPGELRRIRPAGGVDEIARTLEFESPLTAGLFPTDGQQATDPERNTRVRRWDQNGLVRREDATVMQDLNLAGSTGDIEILASGTRLFLEQGILVDFDLDPGGGDFKTGDYWVFAARSTNASIELLDRAPPLGIHHHYARLAVVTFPETDSDCRTLWPPLVIDGDGEGCDCTVCVTSEGHNSDSATIQQAIDAIKDTGGTICLGIGNYNIAEPLAIEGARSLRIRGQGWGTILTGTQLGSIISISGAMGIALENFTAVGAAGGEDLTSIIEAHNVIDFQVEHVNVLGFSLSDLISVGIGLSGFVLGATISECAIIGNGGISTVRRGDSNRMLAAELRVERNVIFCDRRGVSFAGSSLHYGSNRIENNLLLIGRQAVIATGAALPGSSMAIADNVIYTNGDGIHAGVDGLAIERNEITGSNRRESNGNGIELREGLDPVAIDHVRISANRLLNLHGNGIAITQRIEQAIITDNMIDGMGESALVMGEAGAVGQLSFTGNHCLNLGQELDDDALAFAGIQLIRVEQGDILDNVIGNVGRNVAVSGGIDGLRGLALGQVRIAGNRFFGIGPDNIAARVTAANLHPPFYRVAFDNNSINRVGNDEQAPQVIDWRALNIGPAAVGAGAHRVAADLIVEREVAYVLSASYAAVLPTRLPAASIRGNQLHGNSTRVSLNHCSGVDCCHFADNHCQILDVSGRESLLGDFTARTINASNNRLISQGKVTLQVTPGIERAIVMGNTSTGDIIVQGGSPVPADINLTNILGT